MRIRVSYRPKYCACLYVNAMRMLTLYRTTKCACVCCVHIYIHIYTRTVYTDTVLDILCFD